MTVKSKNVHAKAKIPIYILGFFLLSQLVTGLNFGFIKTLKKPIRRFAYCFNVIAVFVLIVLYALPSIAFMLTLEGLYFHAYFCQYLVHFCMLHFTKYNLFRLLTDVNKVTLFAISTAQSIILMFYFSAFFTLKYIFTYAACKSAHTPCPRFYISSNVYSITFYCLDIMTIAHIVIVFCLYSLIKTIVVTLEQGDLNSSFKLYKFMTEYGDKIRPLANKILLVDMIIHVPQIMSSTIISLNFLKQFELDVYVVLGTVTQVVHAFSQMLIPAVIVQMAEGKVQRMIIHLNYLLLKEKNERRKEEVATLLRFVQNRPVFVKLWNVIPQDMQLIVLIFNGINTYLIVAIQFSHLYD